MQRHGGQLCAFRLMVLTQSKAIYEISMKILAER